MCGTRYAKQFAFNYQTPPVPLLPVEKIFYIFVFPQGWVFAVADEGLDAVEESVDRKGVHRIRNPLVQSADSTRHFR